MTDQTPVPATGARPNSFIAIAIAAVVAFIVGGGISYAVFGARADTSSSAAMSPAPGPDDGDVIARVNGKAITEKDLTEASSDLEAELARVPEDKRRGALIQALVDLNIVAQAAEKEGLDKSPDFSRRLGLLRTRALRSEFVRVKVAPLASDDAVKKRYDTEIAKITPQEEVKASHILVETEDEAKAIIEQLKGGADFAAIAKEKSKDPGSGANGGDLGYFAKGNMVPEFEAAAFALKPGEITQTPVKSQFGYHVIKVTDRRKQQPPPFDAVKDQVSQLVMSEAYVEMLKKLKDEAKVELTAAATPPPVPPLPAPAESGEPMDSIPPGDTAPATPPPPPADATPAPTTDAAPATPAPATEAAPATPPATDKPAETPAPTP